MTGRIVLDPSPNAGPPHRCHGMPITQRDDWSMVGAIWQCDDCGQCWLNKETGNGGRWKPILLNQARQLIDAHPERAPT